jgi:hypothetical protein
MELVEQDCLISILEIRSWDLRFCYRIFFVKMYLIEKELRFVFIFLSKLLVGFFFWMALPQKWSFSNVLVSTFSLFLIFLTASEFLLSQRFYYQPKKTGNTHFVKNHFVKNRKDDQKISCPMCIWHFYLRHGQC